MSSCAASRNVQNGSADESAESPDVDPDVHVPRDSNPQPKMMNCAADGILEVVAVVVRRRQHSIARS
jgi:hypothetical protein